MQQAGLQAGSTAHQRISAGFVNSHSFTTADTAQLPHEVRPVDDTATGQVSLSEKAAGLRLARLRVDGEGEGRGQHIAPLIQLVVQLGHYVRELGCIQRSARATRIEELMDSVQEAAHRYASEQVESRLLLLLRRGVRGVGGGQGHGGFNAGDARRGQGRELGEVVALENVAGPKDAADTFLVLGGLVGGRIREQEQALGGGGVDELPRLDGSAEESRVDAGEEEALRGGGTQVHVDDVQPPECLLKVDVPHVSMFRPSLQLFL